MPRAERLVDLVGCFAYAGEDDAVARLGRCCAHALQFAAGDDVEACSAIGEQLENRQRRVGFDCVADQVARARRRPVEKGRGGRESGRRSRRRGGCRRCGRGIRGRRGRSGGPPWGGGDERGERKGWRVSSMGCLSLERADYVHTGIRTQYGRLAHRHPERLPGCGGRPSPLSSVKKLVVFSRLGSAARRN